MPCASIRFCFIIGFFDSLSCPFGTIHLQVARRSRDGRGRRSRKKPSPLGKVAKIGSSEPIFDGRGSSPSGDDSAPGHNLSRPLTGAPSPKGKALGAVSVNTCILSKLLPQICGNKYFRACCFILQHALNNVLQLLARHCKVGKFQHNCASSVSSVCSCFFHRSYSVSISRFVFRRYSSRCSGKHTLPLAHFFRVTQSG